MKNDTEIQTDKKPDVRIDKCLNKYTDVVLFPEKMEILKKDIKKFGIPKPEDFRR